MCVIFILALQFTADYLEFSNSTRAEVLLYQFLSDQSPIREKWDRYVGSDLVKGWYLRETLRKTLFDTLLVQSLSRQVYPRHPILAMNYKQTPEEMVALGHRFDPYSPDILCYQLLKSASEHNLRLTFAWVKELKSYITDFYFQIFLVGNLILYIYFVIFFAVIFILLVLFFKYLPVYVYNLGDILPVPKFFRYVVAAIIVLPIIFLARNFVLFAIMSIIPLYFFATRRERSWIRFSLIWILISIPLSYFIGCLTQTLEGENRAGIIYRTLKIGYNPGVEKIRDPLAIFVNAYISNLHGEWQKADSLYNYLIRIDDEDYLYYNNLGNIRFQLGDLVGAESLYQIAARLSEKSGIPYQNLGTLYLKQLRFHQASKHFRIARARGAPDVDYFIDFNPGRSSLWPRIFTFSLKFPFIFPPGMLVLSIGVFILGSIIRTSSFTNFCSLCQAPLTKESVMGDEQSPLCRGCGIKLQTARDERTKERIINQIRSRNINWNRIKGVIFTLVLPGFAQVYAGRTFRGFLLSLFPIFIYLSYYRAGPILLSPFWLTPDLSSIIIRAMLPALIVSYVLALIGVIFYGPRGES